MSLGSSWTDIDFHQASGVGEIHTTFGSLYGGYISERAYVDGTISYGKSSLANLRNIDILDLPRRAWSEHDAKVFSATLDGGYYLGAERFTWGPFADIRYTRIHEDAFTETGADSINLSVAARTTSALVSGLGVMARRGFIGRNGTYVPEASVAWIHDYGIDDAGVTAGFTDSPDFRFYAPGQPVAEDGARLSLGLSYFGRSGLKTMLHYTGEMRDGFVWHGVSGQLAYEF
jgi:outer membrane autotransporter protein